MIIDVTTLAAGGDGVARDEGGRVTFVPRSAPGDRVDVRVVKETKSFARAEIDRADPAVVLSQKPVFTIADGEAVALGWHLYDLAPGLRVLNHNGGIGGYTSSVYVDPPYGRAAVVLSNVMNEGEAGESIRALARTLLRRPNR